MELLVNQSVLNKIKEKCVAAGITVSMAESVTSGLLQNAFSLAPDAMRFFHGGTTVYNLGQKTRHLDINPVFAEQTNCVSKEIAEKMAVSVAENFCSEIGIGITGYAQEVPELGVEDVFAYVAISRDGKILTSKKIAGDKAKTQFENQIFYVRQTLDMLLENL